MRKPVYIIGLAAAIILSAVYLFKTDASGSDVIEEEGAVEKVYTKTDSLFFRLDTLVSNEIDTLSSVGAALAIIYKGEIAFIKCYGVKKWGENDPIDENTIFRLASVSKTVTGVLAGILSEENIIPLDSRVKEYLPSFKLKDSVNTVDLSIRNILSHTSGLVPHAYDNLVEVGVPMSVVIDSLWRVDISAAPGKLYGYQNVIFSLYDTISRIKTMIGFPELIRKKVFEPFGMKDASAGFAGFESSTNRAYPHSRYNGGYRVLPLNDRYYNTNPAAGINASISDMAHYLAVLSGSDSALAAMHIPVEVFDAQIRTPLKRNYLRRWKNVESKNYGLGWRIIGYRGRQVAYHGGYVQGYNAEIALCREESLGMVFLTNSPNEVGSIAVPTFLDMFFDLMDQSEPSSGKIKVEAVFETGL